MRHNKSNLFFVEIPILEVANLLHLKLLPSPNSIEVMAKCPFCGDERKHFSMNASANQFQCFKCGEKGNSITLYGDIIGIDYSTAYKLLSTGKEFTGNSTSEYAGTKEREPRSLEDRHEVYYDLLQLCGLSKTHLMNLMDRGLDSRFIKQKMYKSVPKGKTADMIAEELSKDYDLLGIPGFYAHNGKWKMVTADGFFIPYLTYGGFIQGFQIRYDITSQTRYNWFSSKGYANGTKAYSWYHVVGWQGSQMINLTEGALKSDIAYYFTGEQFCAIPGTKNYRNLTAWLLRYGIRQVNECLDMDKLSNKNVGKDLEKIKAMILKAGADYNQCTWDSQYKGIDDFHKTMWGLQDPFQYVINGRIAV